MRRVTGSAATVPANTTTLTVVKVGQSYEWSDSIVGCARVQGCTSTTRRLDTSKGHIRAGWCADSEGRPLTRYAIAAAHRPGMMYPGVPVVSATKVDPASGTL